MQMISKKIGDPCPRCTTPLERRKGLFYWRGMYGDGAVCPSCNGLWEIEGEEVLGREQRNVSLHPNDKRDELSEMKNYAELENRLRARTRQVFQVLDAATGECRVTNEPDPDCAEAADAIADLTRTLEILREARGSFPEEHAYMAMLRLPAATSVLRASPEMQAAMATCVTWLAEYLGQSRQYVQEYYEDRIAAEQERLSTESAAKDDATGPADAG